MERTRRDVVAWFRRDMERLVESLSGLREHEWGAHVSDQWTLKDLVGHVAAWDDELRRGIDAVLRNEMPRFAERSEDELNEDFVASRKNMPLEEIVAELGSAHESLVERIEQIDDRDWQRDTGLRWPDGPALTVSSLFDYTYRGQSHYAGHAEEIQQWRVARSRAEAR